MSWKFQKKKGFKIGQSESSKNVMLAPPYCTSLDTQHIGNWHTWLGWQLNLMQSTWLLKTTGRVRPPANSFHQSWSWDHFLFLCRYLKSFIRLASTLHSAAGQGNLAGLAESWQQETEQSGQWRGVIWKDSYAQQEKHCSSVEWTSQLITR